MKQPGQVVFHIERTLGLHPALVQFFRDWQDNGPFPITIPPEGGWRHGPGWERWQAESFRVGATKAKTLEETPHGRKCAADAYPAVVSVGGNCAGILMEWKEGKGRDAHLFHAYGARAEAAGFVWGGRWGFQDAPHIEISNWLNLPFNPRQEAPWEAKP